jgi:glycosyltransferase involved in cell wall biosynthesis
MKRIKVLILIATYRIGGPGKLLFDFCQIAPDYGCEPVLVGFAVGKETAIPFLQEASKRRIRVLRVTHRFRYDPAPIFQVSSLLKEEKPDLLETHGHKANFVAFVLTRISGLPWISFAHGWTDEDWKIKTYNRLDKFLLRYPDRIVAVSKEVARKLHVLNIPDRKIKIIYNAVSRENLNDEDEQIGVREELKIPKEHKLLGVIGRLSPEKGQIYFLQAFSQVIEHSPEVTALIVGEGPDEQRLKQYCASKNLASRVVFMGYQNNLTSIYKSLDLVVLPSLSEGMPMVALEGMLEGKPIIGTGVGGIPEVIVHQKTGLLVPPANPTSLARAILELISDEEKLKNFSENSQTFVRDNFSAEERAKKVVDLYQELLA